MSSYYANKLEFLRDILGVEDIRLDGEVLVVGAQRYPIVDDVIVLLSPDKYPPALNSHLGANAPQARSDSQFANDIQSTFGREWQSFPQILPEHEEEFQQYFDLVDLDELRGKRICDLGCGIGRWSYFLKDVVKELVLVDFSDAIFVARQNLRDCDRSVFFMADVLQLPFRDDCVEFIVCIGVVHHLPTHGLEVVRGLKRLAPNLLVYVYSALDGRPFHYRLILGPVNVIRRLLCHLKSEPLRVVLTWFLTVVFYFPLIAIGYCFRPFGLSRYVPLFDFYHGKSVRRIRQDAYDRFFTRIEQRFDRQEISALKDTFDAVTISPGIPMWHFLCARQRENGSDHG